MIALVGHVSAALIIFWFFAPFLLYTLDFGFDFVFLSIVNTPGAIVSQLQHPIQRLWSTSTFNSNSLRFFGNPLSSGCLSVCSFTVFSYFSQNSFSYLFHHSSFASKSFVYRPQSASGVFCFPSFPHFVLF